MNSNSNILSTNFEDHCVTLGQIAEPANQSAILFEIEETVRLIAEHYFLPHGVGGNDVNRAMFNPA